MSLSVNFAKNAEKRIMKDFMELKTNPIPYISFEINEENLFEGHGNIIVQEGIYKDMIIHIKIIFPNDYPLEPPAAYVAEGFPFDHSFHEHVHSGGSICCEAPVRGG